MEQEGQEHSHSVFSSRRNIFIHDRILRVSDHEEAVDAACQSMTASWVLEKAQSKPGSIERYEYYDSFQAAAGVAASLPSGMYGPQGLKYGERGRNGVRIMSADE